MINKNELRIGNYVQDSGGNFIVVTSIHSEGINLNEQEIETEDGDIMVLEPDYRLEDCFPIPLTPEILEKCGFIKHGEWYILNSLSMPTSINICLPLGIISIGSNEEYELEGFDLVLHSLQNLYFWFTCGEELEIKEPVKQ